MIEKSPLKEGDHVRVTILYTDREVTGVVKDFDATFFSTGTGKVFAFLILKLDDGNISILPLSSIGDIVLILS